MYLFINYYIYVSITSWPGVLHATGNLWRASTLHNPGKFIYQSWAQVFLLSRPRKRDSRLLLTRRHQCGNYRPFLHHG